MSAHINIFNKKRENSKYQTNVSIYKIKIKKVKREKKDWLRW